MIRLVAVCAMAWLLACGSVAFAGKAEKVRAKKIFARAHKLFKKRKYDRAIALFKQAYGLWKHRSIRFNIALAYALKGDKVQAVIHLRQYLKKATAKERKLPELLKRVQGQVGVLVVQVALPKASIFIDGRLAGKQKVEVVVEPGARVVEVRVGDRVVARKIIVLAAGKEKLWELAGTVAVPPRPAPPRPVEPARKPPPPVKPAPATVQPPPAPPVEAALPELRLPRDRPRPLGRVHWGYFAVTASLAVAAGAAAAATTVKAVQLHDRYMDEIGNLNLRKKGMRYEDVANALWGVTGAFGVASVILAIFTRWRGPEKETGVSVMPLVVPRGSGVALSWER
jgi:tetratricopeptide (TPR) repeat protein